MINNLELIKGLIDFPDEDTFYKVDIIIRRKDNSDISSNSKLIKTYCINSIEKLDMLFENEIKPICNTLNARAYFYLNRRSFEKTAFATLKHLTDYIVTHDYKAAKHAYNHACGKTSINNESKRWIFDVDVKCIDIICHVDNNIIKAGGKIYAHIPTKNGFHIITNAFNLQNFNHLIETEESYLNSQKVSDSSIIENKLYRIDILKNICIHKDNGTILYIPDNDKSNK